jgi:hypothetical protein
LMAGASSIAGLLLLVTTQVNWAVASDARPMKRAGKKVIVKAPIVKASKTQCFRRTFGFGNDEISEAESETVMVDSSRDGVFEGLVASTAFDVRNTIKYHVRSFVAGIR